jgi:hypothetical protein
MPMMGSAELSRTTQTPMLATFDDVADAIREVAQAAADAGRDEPLDFLSAYGDPSVRWPTRDAERHRQAFADMEAAGLTWVVVSHPRDEPAAVRDFLEAFGATYLGAES